MPKKFVFLPPPFPAVNDWKAALEEAVDGIDVAVCESREQALTVLPEVDAAFGALDPELLGCAANLQWLACPFAGPQPSFYFPELVASDVTVTNARGVYEDHISAHIMAFILAFARNLHVYLPTSCAANGTASGNKVRPSTCHRRQLSSSASAASARKRRDIAPSTGCTSSASTLVSL